MTLAPLPWFGVDGETGDLHAKRVAEKWTLTFDAVKRMGSGETASSAVWTSTVQAGEDAAASSMIDGASTESGTKSSQLVSLGVDGVTYMIRAAITSSTGQVINGEALLFVSEKVRSDGSVR